MKNISLLILVLILFFSKNTIFSEVKAIDINLLTIYISYYNISDIYSSTIYITFDNKNKRYQITDCITIEGSGPVFLISQGYFDIKGSNIKLVDKNNSLVMIGTISSDTLSFSTGILYLRNRGYKNLISNNIGYSYPKKFTFWNNKIYNCNKKNIFKSKDKSYSKIKNGKYCDKENAIFIATKDETYYIYYVDKNNIIFPISSGNWENYHNKILFKDDDNINIIEAYIIDDTIYPVNHLPFSLDNPPLKLQKK